MAATSWPHLAPVAQGIPCQRDEVLALGFDARFMRIGTSTAYCEAAFLLATSS
ncbi:hypothetical protein [Candidatus Aalborgicola defluviihabitans]|uniref:hypothetical protein n=1 Tax=Candidatus Aalborgicola defluviihabitans TaxID=3386187 RepID=UPI0039096CDD|nr:hypothetical protein [Burkholderiales bacterium]